MPQANGGPNGRMLLIRQTRSYAGAPRFIGLTTPLLIPPTVR